MLTHRSRKMAPWCSPIFPARFIFGRLLMHSIPRNEKRQRSRRIRVLTARPVSLTTGTGFYSQDCWEPNGTSGSKTLSAAPKVSCRRRVRRKFRRLSTTSANSSPLKPRTAMLLSSTLQASITLSANSAVRVANLPVGTTKTGQFFIALARRQSSRWRNPQPAK